MSMTTPRLLIIGNGFDIAHGLPTKYKDFLDFSKTYCRIYETYRNSSKRLSNRQFDGLIDNELDANVLAILRDIFVRDGFKCSTSESIQKDNPFLEELWNMMTENFWLLYFGYLYEEKKLKGLNWIDFESEISDIIQWIDKSSFLIENDIDYVIRHLRESVKFDEKRRWIFEGIRDLCTSENYEQLIDELYSELEKLTRALNIYLCLFVENISIAKNNIIERIDPDFVISFNYTHTFEKLYNSSSQICYIHGECNLTKNMNIVLGIDEYLVDSDRDNKIDMAIFKKFIQRIRNRNDTNYRTWINRWENDLLEYKNQDPIINKKYPKVEVYVYGHSLGVSDKDILSLCLKPENMFIKIYAYNKSEEGKLVSRLIRIIGEDTLIEKAHGRTKRLELLNCN